MPWKVDVPLDRRPYTNWLILVALVVAFAFQILIVAKQRAKLPAKIRACKSHSVEDVAKELGVDEQQLKEIEKSAEQIIESRNKSRSGGLSTHSKDDLIKQIMLEKYFAWRKLLPFVLKGWGIKDLLGHMWLHGGIIHLVGNMLFLWIFGNSVCSKIGDYFYLPIYLIIGMIAGMTHLLFGGGYALGASGAINGIVGMYLVFFPENEITCYIFFWLIYTPYVREFCVSSIWMILFWLAFDIFGAMMGREGVAYLAHLGGFAGGVVIAILMLKLKLVVMEEGYEKSLLQMFSGRSKPHEYESTPFYIGHTGLTARDLEGTEPVTVEPATPKTIPLEPAAIPSAASAIPSAPEIPKEEFIRFTCSCGKRFKVPAKYAGKTGKCSKCKLRIKIPDK